MVVVFGDEDVEQVLEFVDSGRLDQLGAEPLTAAITGVLVVRNPDTARAQCSWPSSISSAVISGSVAAASRSSPVICEDRCRSGRVTEPRCAP